VGIRVLVCLFAVARLAHGDSGDPPVSPYAGQETRDIKSLSPEEVDAYLSGKGLGLAKAAAGASARRTSRGSPGTGCYSLS
jgi:hypothetical protein